MAKKEEKISIFGQAKVKTGASKPKDDKEVVYINGLEPKLLELDFLKAQIKDLEAQLGSVSDEIKNISKEKFVKLYQENKSNPNTFLIKDGEGCVMVIPTDKYISIKDEDRANQLIDEYGDDIITIDEKYYFNPQILERNMAAIEKLIMDAKTISTDDKRNLLVKEVKYSITKGYIDKLAQYGSKIETVLDDIQPIITLKNCGGKMEEGGEMGSYDFIANVYEHGSVVDGEYANGGGVGKLNYDKDIEVVEDEQELYRKGWNVSRTGLDLERANKVWSWAKDDTSGYDWVGGGYSQEPRLFKDKKGNYILAYKKYDWASDRYKGDKFSNGGGVEDNFDYGSDLTDEAMVKQNLMNGEISCETLTKIIGCQPSYPYQVVGAIKLEKCYLRPYYKLA